MQGKTMINVILLAVLITVGLDTEACEMKNVVEGGNSFSVKLYLQLAGGEEGNLFFSPASIYTALGMTFAGAKGQTAEQMAETLQLGQAGENVHKGFADLLEKLNSPRMMRSMERVGREYEETEKPAYQLIVANALWGQKGYPWRKGFLELTAEDYGAGLHEVDFAGNKEAARKTINGWVEQETKDRIKDLIPRGALNALTRLVLTNAVYFKANWEDAFIKAATQDKPFHISADKKVVVPLMFMKDSFGYMETETFQALEMPYKADELSMVVFLPKAVDGLGRFEKSPALSTISGCLNKLKREEVEVTFPRFKFTSSFSLSRTLEAMGMTDAFSASSADFSGMTSEENLYLSEVIHKAFVALDEEGTEAAAATAIMMVGTAARMHKPKPKVFKADHPFLFLILHKPTGSILFIGRVMNPA